MGQLKNWALGTLVCLATLAQSPAFADAPQNATAEQIAANDAAAILGERMYRHDQAAWHGTDALTAKIDLSRESALRGYLTEELDNGSIALVFYAEYDGGEYEFARFEVDGDEVVSGGILASPRDHPLSLEQLRQIAAKEAAVERAIEEKISLCAKPPINTLVLPPDENDQVSVYLMTAPQSSESYPLGGHYLFKVGSDNMVESFRPFMKTCLDVPTGGQADAEGNTPVAYVVTHILDDQPTEIHHFVRRYTMPIGVSAGDGLWMID